MPSADLAFALELGDLAASLSLPRFRALDLPIWDYAALVPILEEAGGRVSGLDGGPLRPKEQVVPSNGLLHDELLALLNQR